MTDTAEVKTVSMETQSALPPEETERLNGENGDSLWYAAVAALKNGQPLTKVIWKLLKKLRGRYDEKLLHASGETLEERRNSKSG